MQPKLGDRLGLHQHEAGAEEEERQIAAIDRLGKADGLAHKEVAQQQHHPERDHVGDGIGALDHVEERPVVGRHRRFRIGLREILRHIGKADRGERARVRHRGRPALPGDKGGGAREVIQHPHRQRLSRAGQVAQDFRQLEAEGVVDQRERDRQHAARPEQPIGLRDALTGIDVGIHPQVGGVAQRGVRIQHAVDDQVILLGRGAEEVAGVVDRQVDPRIVIRPLRVIFGAEEGDGGIDLDGVDMGRPHPQRGGDIVAAAGADDGDALRRLLEVVGELVISANVAIGIGFLAALVVGEIIDLLVVAAA